MNDDKRNNDRPYKPKSDAIKKECPGSDKTRDIDIRKDDISEVRK